MLSRVARPGHAALRQQHIYDGRRTAGSAHQIDPRLLDSLYIMQQWLMAYERPHEIQVLSGYRTPEHNANLEGAAKNSMHLQGRAVDVHIPGMKTDVLSNMAKMIGVGGVGLYQDRGFIHVDTGPVRSWESRRRKG